MNIRKRQSGFTLAEMLMTVAVFSILSVVVSNIFLNVNKLQRQTAVLQRVQNEGRYMIEKIAREVRAREVAYPLTNPQPDLLFLEDEQGDILKIAYADSNNDEIKDVINYILNNEPAQLNAEDIEVTGLSFFVAPTLEDEWSLEPKTNIQPRVTILLKLRSRGPIAVETTVQTTISSKIYRR